jgi:hypothetical protein
MFEFGAHLSMTWCVKERQDYIGCRAFAGSVPTIDVRSGPAHGQGLPDAHYAGLLER